MMVNRPGRALRGWFGGPRTRASRFLTPAYTLLLCSVMPLHGGSAAELAAQPPTEAPSTGQPTTGGDGEAVTPLGEVQVNAPRPVPPGDNINLPESTGSRLGLSQMDTPATVNVITPETNFTRGYDHVEDAVDSAPGITSGGTPGDPSQFSFRGFTGNEVTNLRDGSYVGPASMVYRPQNTFNLKSTEVLQGPASVLYGQGAVGGVINTVTKQPEFGPSTGEFYSDYGSFNTATVGLGAGTQVGKDVAVRLDASRTSSDGYVPGSNPNSLNVTGSALWRINPNLSLLVGIDYLHDQLPAYYGTPLQPASTASHPVPGLVDSSAGLTIDRDTLFKNYDVRDFSTKSTSIAPRSVLTWQAAPNITVTNELEFYYAQRRWQNAETYTYVTPDLDATNAAGQPIPPGQIARDRFHVYHNQHEVTDRTNLVADGQLFGLPNRVSFGIQEDYIRFIRNSGFPDATYADSVDASDPVRGLYGDFPGDNGSRKSPTTIVDLGIFAEDILSLTPKLKLVTGVRVDYFDLDRENFSTSGVFQPSTSFHDDYVPDNGRIGLVYALTPRVSLYGAFTTAQDPPNSNVFLANRGQIPGLSDSEQGEIGAKTVFLNGRADATVSLYTIDRTNILVTTSADTVTNVGSEHSDGVELSGDLALTSQWSVSANAALTEAQYGVFRTSATTDASGNTPPDVPRVTSNVWTEYKSVAGTPLDIGGGMRFVGDRMGDYANTLKLKEYALFDVYATYHLTDKVAIRGRIDNIFNKTYVQWVDTSYPSQVLLGEPRFFGISLHATL